jgi:hypothetical protein
MVDLRWSQAGYLLYFPTCFTHFVGSFHNIVISVVGLRQRNELDLRCELGRRDAYGFHGAYGERSVIASVRSFGPVGQLSKYLEEPKRISPLQDRAIEEK